MFQNNPLTGAIFLLAILVNSLVAREALGAQGVSALMLFGGAILGTVVGTATAKLLGADRGLIGAGLYGFNGTLVGIAFPFYLQTTPLMIVYLVIGAAFSSIIMSTLLSVLGQWEIPALTAPFVLTTWLFLVPVWSFAGLRGTGFLPLPGLSSAPASAAALDFSGFWQGTLEGVGEVMFQIHWLAGIIFLIGILVNSRISFVFALIGSLIGLIVGYAMGASTEMLSLGLYGFNPVLTGIALGGFFFVLDWKSALYAIFGIVVTTIIMGALVSALAPLGLPALTWPFILVTWFFIGAKPFFSQLRAVPPAKATTPEGNLSLAV
jgi:urea transporter